ncbi:MAG: UbiX family flavin prenyltransferase [Candidatus Thermoplasmatota archaeon]|nr:UbiX family flavin prenyltransferase [Candidatus Thermoplasmatota archaeon]
MKQVLVGITGASGSIYGVGLLQELQKKDVSVHLIFSKTAKQILPFETNNTVESVMDLADEIYENDDLFAGPASGSFQIDAMVLVPCSMKTLAAIATGYADCLITRSASVMLKENKSLIVVPRETPFDLAGLQNMIQVHLAGGTILPASPGFYHKPASVSDLVDFIVGKILDQLSIPHDLFKRWE